MKTVNLKRLRPFIQIQNLQLAKAKNNLESDM